MSYRDPSGLTWERARRILCSHLVCSSLSQLNCLSHFFPRRPPSWQRAEPAYVNLTHCGNQPSPSSDSADPKSIHFTRSLNSLLADESREAQCGVSVATQGDVERGRVARFRVNGSKAAQLLLSLRCASILARSGNRKENTSWHEQLHPLPPNPKEIMLFDERLNFSKKLLIQK